MGYYPQFLLHVCPENKNNPGEKTGLTQTQIGSHRVKCPISCGEGHKVQYQLWGPSLCWVG